MSNAMHNWVVVSKKRHQVSPRCTAEETTFKLPGGKLKTIWTKVEGKTVAVLPVTPNGTIVLARQYRPGPNRIVDELPGGRCETGESPEEAARRELFEETGLEAESWLCLGTFLECAYSTVERWGFAALNVRQTRDVVFDQEEPVEVVEKNLDQFIQQLCEGQICDPEIAWAGLYRMKLVTVSSGIPVL